MFISNASRTIFKLKWAQYPHENAAKHCRVSISGSCSLKLSEPSIEEAGEPAIAVELQEAAIPRAGLRILEQSLRLQKRLSSVKTEVRPRSSKDEAETAHSSYTAHKLLCCSLIPCQSGEASTAQEPRGYAGNRSSLLASSFPLPETCAGLDAAKLPCQLRAEPRQV